MNTPEPKKAPARFFFLIPQEKYDSMNYQTIIGKGSVLLFGKEGYGLPRKKVICLLLAVSVLLSGCGGAPALPSSQDTTRALTPQTADFTPYAAPPMATSAYHPEAAQSNGSASIDVSAVSEGYVAVSATSASRLKFQVVKGEETYNYNLASDGTPSIFPLQCGSGSYRFRVMENVSDSKYSELFSLECDVTLLDEFQPFLRPSDYVNYNADSQCVRKAAELAANAPDALGVVGEVYRYVCQNVRYDRDKAATVQSGYLPVPDETMSTGRGICFDYAALAAAMLRSQGIPTKLVFGYVSPDNLYHAWNMVYTEETGWVAVSFEVRENGWNRLDLTFSANGADSSFIGDGTNYSDVYYY